MRLTITAFTDQSLLQEAAAIRRDMEYLLAASSKLPKSQDGMNDWAWLNAEFKLQTRYSTGELMSNVN